MLWGFLGPGLREGLASWRAFRPGTLHPAFTCRESDFPWIRGLESATLAVMHNHMLWYDWILAGGVAAYFVLCWIVPRGSW
jgi:hypothetical protein